MSEEFRGEVASAFRQILVSLQPLERALVIDTEYNVQATPSAAQQGGRRGLLLGLYTAPPPRIFLFEDNIRRVGKTAYEVLAHEIGHRLGYDHAIESIVHACGMPGSCLEAEMEAAESPPAGWAEACPACLMHDFAAQARGLMDGLASPAVRQGRIPQGLGGTIPLARRDLALSHAALHRLAQLMPDRAGEARLVENQLDQAYLALSGHLTADRAQAAADLTRAAWRSAHQMAWTYFLRHGH